MLPATEQVNLNFIAFLDLQNYAGSTIVTFLSAVGHYYKASGYPSPLTSYNVNRTVSSLAKKSLPDSRLPITVPILSDLLSYLSQSQNRDYHKVLFTAVFTLAFFGCLRISEFACNMSNNQHVLLCSSIDMYSDYLTITFKSFKHSTQPLVVAIKALPGSIICPITAMRNYLSIRQSDSPYLFVLEGGTPLHRTVFNTQLKLALSYVGIPTTNFTSHSFRIGGATNALLSGYSMAQIQQLGRWRSNAFIKYLRPYQVLVN